MPGRDLVSGAGVFDEGVCVVQRHRLRAHQARGNVWQMTVEHDFTQFRVPAPQIELVVERRIIGSLIDESGVRAGLGDCEVGLLAQL